MANMETKGSQTSSELHGQTILNEEVKSNQPPANVKLAGSIIHTGKGVSTIELLDKNMDLVARVNVSPQQGSPAYELYPVDDGNEADNSVNNTLSYNCSPENFSEGYVRLRVAGAQMGGTTRFIAAQPANNNVAYRAFVDGNGVAETLIPFCVTEGSIFPISSGEEGFESYPADDTPLTTLEIGDLDSGNPLFNNRTETTRSADGRGYGDVGRALKVQHIPEASLTSHSCQWNWTHSAANYSVASFGAWEASFKMKLDDSDPNASVPDVSRVMELNMGIGSFSANSSQYLRISRLASGKLRIASSAQDSVDTAADADQWNKIDFSVNDSGNVSVKLNDVEIINETRSFSQSSSFVMSLFNIGSYSTADTHEIPALLIDDLDLTVSSGVE